MSSRSITRRDLESIAATFRVIAQPRPFGAVTSLGFAVAAELLELLKEAKWELEDLLSTKRSIAGWGPGYFNLGDDGVRDHHLGFELFRARTSRKPPRFRLLSAFVFPTGRNQRIRWQVYAYDYLSWESIGGCELDQPADRLLDRSGHLTCDRLVDSVADCVRKWRPAFL